MSKIKINTDRVNALAEIIATINDNQQSNFNEMNNEVCKLNESWNSNVGRKAKESFEKYVNLEKKRFDNINQMVQVLKKEIVEGSEITEIQHKSLADRFK